MREPRPRTGLRLDTQLGGGEPPGPTGGRRGVGGRWRCGPLSYVYVIAEAGSDGMIKVGMSDWPPDRRYTLALAAARKLTIEATFGVPRRLVSAAEKVCHGGLRKRWAYQGEWYDAPLAEVIAEVHVTLQGFTLAEGIDGADLDLSGEAWENHARRIHDLSVQRAAESARRAVERAPDPGPLGTRWRAGRVGFQPNLYPGMCARAHRCPVGVGAGYVRRDASGTTVLCADCAAAEFPPHDAPGTGVQVARTAVQ